MGTHNALVGLGGCYLELIAPDPEQPDPGRPRPFGIDGRSDSQLVAFAVRPSDDETIEDLSAAIARQGRDPGPIREMHRRTPSGETLSWRLTVPDDPESAIPFLIDWGDTPRPDTTVVSGPDLVELEVVHADPSRITALYEALALANPVRSRPRVVAGSGTSLSAGLAGGVTI